MSRTHGKASTYSTGCRCEPCRCAWREWSRSNVKQKIHRRARNLAAKWVHDERPDLWESLVEQATTDVRIKGGG